MNLQLQQITESNTSTPPSSAFREPIVCALDPPRAGVGSDWRTHRARTSSLRIHNGSGEAAASIYSQYSPKAAVQTRIKFMSFESVLSGTGQFSTTATGVVRLARAITGITICSWFEALFLNGIATSCILYMGQDGRRQGYASCSVIRHTHGYILESISCSSS